MGQAVEDAMVRAIAKLNSVIVHIDPCGHDGQVVHHDGAPEPLRAGADVPAVSVP